MKVHLIAVQADMAPGNYESAERFREKILQLTDLAVEGTDDAPKLIVFPETIGFPLLLSLGANVSDYESVTEVVLSHVRRSWLELLGLALQRGLVGLPALYRLQALAAYTAYRDAFRAAAVRSGATIVAGTSFLPHIEEEAARGVHVAGRRVHNTAFTFAPTGRVLNRSRKAYLTSGAESRAGLSRARRSELNAFETPVGRVGVAICLDGFYGSIIDHFDGQGVRIVVQPSANHAAWDRRWPADPRLSEGEAWLRKGLRAQVQDRQHIRYGVNPMLVGDLWDLKARGRSSVVCNLRYFQAACEGYPGVVVLAASADREEIVRATVDLP